MKYDAIIIGAGLGGLECAYMLSKTGRHVLVLEQAHTPGGCLQSYRRGQFDYDTGLHCVGGLNDGPLHDLFSTLGLLKLPWHRLDNQFERFIIGDREYAFQQGYTAFRDGLIQRFPTQHKGLTQYVDLLVKTRNSQHFGPHTDRMAQSDNVSLFDQNAYTYLKETLVDDELISLIGAPAMKLELQRDTLPLFSFLHVHNSYIYSSWRLKGPGSQIIDSLIHDIRAMGSEVLCSTRVTALDEHDGRITHAIDKRGEVYEAEYFISDIHPSLTYPLVQESCVLKPLFRSRISRQPNTSGMFTLSLQMKPHALPYFNWNQYVYAQPNTIWDGAPIPTATNNIPPLNGIMLSCRVPDNNDGYARQVDILTPMSWEVCRPWVDTSVGRRGSAYLDMKAQMTEQCLTLAESFIPSIRSKIERTYTSTPLTYRDYTGAPDGTAFGLRKDCHAPLLTFLSVRTPIQNLLLTGQNLVLHGVEGVSMTALATFEAIAGTEARERLLGKGDAS